MARSKSSGRWLKEHFDDPYVQKAQAEGRRSRASFKLEEVQARDHLIREGHVVVDLGAALRRSIELVFNGQASRLHLFARYNSMDSLPMWIFCWGTHRGFVLDAQ